MRLEFDVEGRSTALGTGDGGKRASGDQASPQIFFLAGGEILPGYTLRLLAEDSRVEYRIAPGEEQWTELTEVR
ncbi:MAG: hypothetical protein U5K43_07435 [Halofilum sp. (in: g-proteobacteria)]|nr:hypothetical protein [Halofilum sp. (in: g-proteobacteria)]